MTSHFIILVFVIILLWFLYLIYKENRNKNYTKIVKKQIDKFYKYGKTVKVEEDKSFGVFYTKTILEEKYRNYKVTKVLEFTKTNDKNYLQIEGCHVLDEELLKYADFKMMKKFKGWQKLQLLKKV